MYNFGEIPLIKLKAFFAGIALGALCIAAPMGMEQTAEAAEGTVNKIAAVVNGEMITLHELRTLTAAELARRSIPPTDARADQVQRNVLDSLINNILLRQEAERLKVTVPESDIDGEIRRLAARANMSQQAFEEQMKRQGGIKPLRDKLRENILRQRIMHHMVARKVIVPREEIAKYYETHKDEFNGEKVADFSIIFFPPNVKAKAILDQIKGGSMSFEDAARQYSLDPGSKPMGGRVEKAPWKALGPRLQTTLNSLKDNELSQLLNVEGTQVLVRRNSIFESKPLNLTEATPRIEEILAEPRMQERFKEYAQQLRDKAVVDIRL